MVDPESELQELRARAAISAVLQRYARAVDARDAVLLRSCFHDDAIAHYFERQECPTPEHLVEWVLGAVGRYEGTQHLNGVSEIEVEGEVAWTTTPLQAAHMRGEDRGGGILFIGGIYTDRLTCVDGEWRIAERRFEALWREDTASGKSG